MIAARVLVALVFVAVAARIFFWAYTDRVWEDALITILHAENAAAGIGLTHFKVDEPPIHGFTSPLSVLVPLLGEVLHRGWGLDTIRLFSLAAGAATVWIAGLLIRATPGLAMPTGLLALACGFLAIEHHQILWGMAGMETQLACAILLFSAWCYVRRDYRLLGVACALCVLVRPDFAIWTGIIGAFLLLDCRDRRSFRPLAITIGIALALYLPWILFTTLYYGSPIPNTILAKSAGYMPWSPDTSTLSAAVSTSFVRLQQLIVTLGPAFGGNGAAFILFPAHDAIANLMLAFVAVSFVTALVERRRELLLLHGFFIIYAAYYLFLVPVIFPWYVVPYTAVAIVLAAHGVATLLRLLPEGRPRAAAAWVACAAYLGVFAYHLPTTFRAERNIQALVEEPIRVAIGRYLHETPPDTTIGGEPLGFVGYYSRRTYYDYPGLASRRVVDFLKRSGNRSLLAMLREIQPHYLVLRDFELNVLYAHGHHGPWARSNYAEERKFVVGEAARSRLFRPDGNVDLSFVLLKRTTPRPEILDTERLGPPLARITPSVEGAWTPNGGFTGVPGAPQGAPWFGSWSGNDANVGRIRYALPALEVGSDIGVPFLTGPMTEGLSIRIVDAASGEPVQWVDWLPQRAHRWAVWRVKIPESARGRALALEAHDQGKEWGQWLAVAPPHALLAPAPSQAP